MNRYIGQVPTIGKVVAALRAAGFQAALRGYKRQVVTPGFSVSKDGSRFSLGPIKVQARVPFNGDGKLLPAVWEQQQLMLPDYALALKEAGFAVVDDHGLWLYVDKKENDTYAVGDRVYHCSTPNDTGIVVTPGDTFTEVRWSRGIETNETANLELCEEGN